MHHRPLNEFLFRSGGFWLLIRVSYGLTNSRLFLVILYRMHVLLRRHDDFQRTDPPSPRLYLLILEGPVGRAESVGPVERENAAEEKTVVFPNEWLLKG